MFERFERPVKIICLGLAALLAWQLGSVLLGGDPLAHLKIPALPTLPGATNEPAKGEQKATNAAVVAKTGTNGTNATIGTNLVGGTNIVKGTNVAHGTNMARGTNTAQGTNMAHSTNVVQGTNVMAKSTNNPAAGETVQTDAGSTPKPGALRRSNPPGMPPEMMANLPPGIRAQMMAGGMSGGRMGGGMKKIELPPEVQTRVDRIIDSELFGAVTKPMPMALIGLADQEAYIRATNGQTDRIKLGGEMGGIKLLRIGFNRALVEQDGEKKELTIFGGVGGESLMPKPTNEPSTNLAATNAPSTNGPSQRAAKRKAATNDPSTNQNLSPKQKEIP
jgi:hypothetical protein